MTPPGENGAIGAECGLPAEWASTTLDDLGTWTGGGTPKKSVPEYWDGDVPWVSPKDMKSIRLAGTRDHITEAAIDESAAKAFPANSIAIVVRSGILEHTLPIALLPFRAAANQDMKILTPRSETNPEWLLYALLGSASDIRERCRKHGTTVASIDFPKLRSYPLAVPPRTQQDCIVEAIDARIAGLGRGVGELGSAETALARFQASVLAAAVTGRLTPSVETSQSGAELLDEILRERQSDRSLAEPQPPPGIELPTGWTWATVDQLASLIQYGSSAKADKAAEGVPVLRMGNIWDGRLRLDDLKYLPADHAEFPKLLLETGDVLFNRTNSPELVGKAAVFGGEPTPCSFASYLIRVRLDHRYHPELLVYYLNSALGRAWVGSVVSQQVGQANVNGSKLKQLTVPVPPLEEQMMICKMAETELTVVEEMRNTIRNARARADALRRATLEAAVSGTLVPQDPSAMPTTEAFETAAATS